MFLIFSICLKNSVLFHNKVQSWPTIDTTSYTYKSFQIWFMWRHLELSMEFKNRPYSHVISKCGHGKTSWKSHVYPKIVACFIIIQHNHDKLYFMLHFLCKGISVESVILEVRFQLTHLLIEQTICNASGPSSLSCITVLSVF